MSLEGGFLFVTFGNADEVVCVLEINLGIHASFPRSIQQVINKRKWVAVFLCDLVKTTEVNA